MNKVLPLIVILLLCVILAVALIKHDGESPLPSKMIGKVPETFSLPLLNYTREASLSDWRGKVVVVNIFASWCESCRVEHAVLLKIKEATHVESVGIAWKDTPERVTSFLKEFGNPFSTILVDEKGASTMKLALAGVPETFVFAKDGRVAYNKRSVLTEDDLYDVIVPLVKELQNEK